MKVLCIDSGLNKCYNTGRIVKTPVPLERYNVLKVYNGIGNRSKELFYVIKELTENVGYESHLFIPLSNIDETELVNKREETLASLKIVFMRCPNIEGKDYGVRRSGRTTKIVDQLINDFFTFGVADCCDHYPSNDMYKYVMHKVLGRLEYEHNLPIKEIKIDKLNNILVNKLIPDSITTYKELVVSYGV